MHKLPKRLVVALFMLTLTPLQASSPAAAGTNSGEQRAFNEITRLIGANFDELNHCLDLNDERVCFSGLVADYDTSPYIAGLGFAIASILKFKFHHDIPTLGLPQGEIGSIAAFELCLESGENPSICTWQLDPRLDRLAVQLVTYRSLRPFCQDGQAACNRPFDWPGSWPWAFEEALPETRR